MVCLFAVCGVGLLSLMVVVLERALKMRSVELYSVEYIMNKMIVEQETTSAASFI